MLRHRLACSASYLLAFGFVLLLPLPLLGASGEQDSKEADLPEQSGEAVIKKLNANLLFALNKLFVDQSHRSPDETLHLLRVVQERLLSGSARSLAESNLARKQKYEQLVRSLGTLIRLSESSSTESANLKPLLECKVERDLKLEDTLSESMRLYYLSTIEFAKLAYESEDNSNNATSSNLNLEELSFIELRAQIANSKSEFNKSVPSECNISKYCKSIRVKQILDKCMDYFGPSLMHSIEPLRSSVEQINLLADKVEDLIALESSDKDGRPISGAKDNYRAKNPSEALELVLANELKSEFSSSLTAKLGLKLERDRQNFRKIYTNKYLQPCESILHPYKFYANFIELIGRKDYLMDYVEQSLRDYIDAVDFCTELTRTKHLVEVFELVSGQKYLLN